MSTRPPGPEPRPEEFPPELQAALAKMSERGPVVNLQTGETVAEDGKLVLHPFEPDSAVPPGETLSEYLVDVGISRLVDSSGLTVTQIEGILHAMEPITKDIADKLASATEIPARFWLSLEADYQANLRRTGKDKQG